MKTNRHRPLTRFLIIANPAAARGSAAGKINLIQRELEKLGLDFEIRLTERTWQAAELAQEGVLEGFDVVTAAGGDGTTNEVLNGLMLAKTAGLGEACLGVLCIGQGNDFAFSMGNSLDIVQGCRALAENRRKRIDLGKACSDFFPTGRYFGNGVGIGFDAVVDFLAARLTNIKGFKAYAAAAVQGMFYYTTGPVVHIELDDQSLTQRSLMISIMNGRRMGGGFIMTPDSQPDDGYFDLCIASQVNRLKLASMIPRFMAGTQVGDSAITMAKSRRVVITAVEGTLPAHLDGEILCTRGQKISLEIVPAALEIVY